MSDYKTCSNCGQTFPETTEYFLFYSSGTAHHRCRKCDNAYLKGTRDKRREQYRADQKKWRDNNRDLIRGENVRSYNTHKEYNRQRRRDYYAEHGQDLEKARIRYHQREARKRGLPHDFTIAQARYCLWYWGHECAVCSRSRNDKITLAFDHWIPLASADCPGTVATNIVPLCHGIGGCNNEKGDRDALEWLTAKLGESAALDIIAGIESYFASLEPVTHA